MFVLLAGEVTGSLVASISVSFVFVFIYTVFVLISGELGLGQGGAQKYGVSASQMGDNLPILDLGSGFRIAKLRCAEGHCCALSTDADLKCWVKWIE